MVKRHINIIEQDVLSLSKSIVDFNPLWENTSTIVKGNSLCQQGLFSVLKYLSSKLDFSQSTKENVNSDKNS